MMAAEQVGLRAAGSGSEIWGVCEVLRFRQQTHLAAERGIEITGKCLRICGRRHEDHLQRRTSNSARPLLSNSAASVGEPFRVYIIGVRSTLGRPMLRHLQVGGSATGQEVSEEQQQQIRIH